MYNRNESEAIYLIYNTVLISTIVKKKTQKTLSCHSQSLMVLFSNICCSPEIVYLFLACLSLWNLSSLRAETVSP